MITCDKEKLEAFQLLFMSSYILKWECLSDRVTSGVQYSDKIERKQQSYTLGSSWVVGTVVSVKEKDLKILISKSTISHLFPLHVPEWGMKRDCFLGLCHRTHSALSYDNLCHLWDLWNLWQLNSDRVPTRHWYLFFSNREFIYQGFTALLARRIRGKQIQRK